MTLAELESAAGLPTAAIVRFILDSKEYRNFGFNPMTLGSLGAVTCTGVQAWGLAGQMKAIRTERSAESMPFDMFAYSLFFLWSLVCYGIHLKSLTLVFCCSVLGALYLEVLVLLSVYSEISSGEIVLLAASALMVPAMILLPQKRTMYLIFDAGVVLFSLRQPWEIWKNRNAGVVQLGYLAAFLVSGFFWSVYSYAIRDWAMSAVCTGSTVLTGITLAFWVRFRPGM